MKLSAQTRNLLFYAGYTLLGALVATGLHLSTQLAGDDPILWRPLAATFTATLFGALATAVGASTRTRVGSEPLAVQVDALRKEGVPRTEMRVVDAASESALYGRLAHETTLLLGEGYRHDDLMVAPRSGIDAMAARVGGSMNPPFRDR